MDVVRRWIRKNTRPIPREKARLWQFRLSFAYYMLAWTGTGLILYELVTKGEKKGLPESLDVHSVSDPNESRAHKYARMMNVSHATIYRIKNFKLEEVTAYVSEDTPDKRTREERATEDFYGQPLESSDDLDQSL